MGAIAKKLFSCLLHKPYKPLWRSILYFLLVGIGNTSSNQNTALLGANTNIQLYQPNSQSGSSFTSGQWTTEPELYVATYPGNQENLYALKVPSASQTTWAMISVSMGGFSTQNGQFLPPNVSLTARVPWISGTGH